MGGATIRGREKERERGCSAQAVKAVQVRMLHKHAVARTCDGPGRVRWRADPVP